MDQLAERSGSEQAKQGTFAGRWHSQQHCIDAAWDFEDAAAILNAAMAL